MNNINSILSQSYIQQKHIYKTNETTKTNFNQSYTTNLDIKLPDSRFYLPLIKFKGLNNSQIMFGSALEEARKTYKPVLPSVLAAGIMNVSSSQGNLVQAAYDVDFIKNEFKLTHGEEGKPIITFNVSPVGSAPKTSNIQGNVGVILSGGQAPGGHNVIAGIFDALKQANPDSNIIGFLNGPIGIVNGNGIQLSKMFVDKYRNTGGFDMIGSGRDKIEKIDITKKGNEHKDPMEMFIKTLENCKKNNIKQLVIIGGDDSNTNAAVLAEYFQQQGEDIKVIGVPKTIDGDLKNKYIETSFGFDTATKVYSGEIGSIERDALSAKKYSHFIKMMGRNASSVTQECALQTHPNLALISEEVAAKKMTLDQVADKVTDVVVKRALAGKNYGVYLIPEGLIDEIPETKVLMKELSTMLKNIDSDENARKEYYKKNAENRIKFIKERLKETNEPAYHTFVKFPQSIQSQLIKDRDAHGNVQVSKIDTEQLMIHLVSRNINRLNAKIVENNEKNGTKVKEIKFSPQGHFLGYEGRCEFPSNFDTNYCYALGYNAVALINSGATGYMSTISDLTKPAKDWKAGGVPITSMMNAEVRNGELKPVIKKALVDLNGPVFKEFARQRDSWVLGNGKDEYYDYPGPIQYYGPDEVCNSPTKTLKLEQGAA